MSNNASSSAARSHAAAPLLATTLRIGIFFDGTGNNRRNSQIGADCRAMAEVNNGAHIQACGGRHADPDSSYSAELTNIARLAALYRERPVAAVDGEQRVAFRSLYVSGIGTTSGGRDSVFSGQGFGRGATGVIGKVGSCVKKLCRTLDQFKRDNPTCYVARLELDVFGFSRGAAAARHLANEVLKQHEGSLNVLFDRQRFMLGADFSWSNDSLVLKVIGLFDTVAAVGGISDMGNVRDSVNKRVNLFLPPGCAQQVLHLVAADEQRRNFVLNSVLPDWLHEIVVPGAHSDVGGGYPMQMREKVALTQPRFSLVSSRTACEDTPACQQSQQELEQMDVQRWLDPRDPGASMKVECQASASTTAAGLKEVVATVYLERLVFGHLSLVYMQMMHALACAEGVPFEPIPQNLALSLPPELRPIADKLLRRAQGKGGELTAAEMQCLTRRYIHRSAHWNSRMGRFGLLSQFFFIHAPERLGRVQLPNCEQPGYPQ